MSDEAIKTVAGEITKIAVEHGYNGVAPKTITGAIDALADTLAGSDVDSGRTIAEAVRALAPYIGSGGGGGFEPKGTANITIGRGLTVPEGEYFLFKVDSRGPLQSVAAAIDYGNMYNGVATSSDLMGTSFGTVGGGLYVAVAVSVSSADDVERLTVKYGYEVTLDFTKFVNGTDVLLSFQVPESDQGGPAFITISCESGDDEN